MDSKPTPFEVPTGTTPLLGEGCQATSVATFKFDRSGSSSTMSTVWDTYEKWLNDPDPDVRRKAIQDLGSIHDSPGNVNDNVLLALAHFAKHPDPISRIFVASSSGKRHEGGIPLLSLLAMDQEEKVREWVAGSLGNAGSAAIPLIKRLVQDSEGRVRVSAVSSLCLVRKGHRLLLLKLLFHRDEGVRKWARVGLRGNSPTDLCFLESAAEIWDPKGSNARVLLDRMGRGKDWLRHALDELRETQSEDRPSGPATS